MLNQDVVVVSADFKVWFEQYVLRDASLAIKGKHYF